LALVLINPPLIEPVSLPEIKEYCRIDAGDTSQDTTLIGLATDARAYCETFTARRFVQQTWQLLMDFFPGYIDLKLAGSKVSSPFVSGSNAVLVGIRYAIVLPYPPVQSLGSFVYQNANGQVTSMITGPAAISSVANVYAQPLTVTTSIALNLQSGAGVVVGASSLLNYLGGNQFQTITVLSPTTFQLNGTVGDGVTSITGGGTIGGYNFVYDLASNPARLAPVFGQMWPVARVVLNAVQVNYTVGYANPITVSIAANSTAVTSANYTFEATDIGRPINIPGAGPNGNSLNTIVLSISSPPGAGATFRDQASAAVTNVTGLIVNNPNAQPGHWEKIKRAIKVYTVGAYENRMPMKNVEDTVERILYPVRDLRF
jgi:hypothetical protein